MQLRRPVQRLQGVIDAIRLSSRLVVADFLSRRFWYNFVKQHKTLKGISPAMASGLSETLWSVTDLAEMVDAVQPKPGKRGPYTVRGNSN